MKILIVCKEVIPVTLYGGVERIAWYLGRELVNIGHEVTYLVKPGSKSDFATTRILDLERKVADQIPDNIDLVHYHYTPDDVSETPVPYLITVHGNRNDKSEHDINSVFVSGNHALRYGSSTWVYNGLDWSDYSKPDLTTERKYFHFLGKAAWRIKNVQGAIDTISKTKREKLKVLGGTRINLKMGMRFTLSPRISFHGMVGGIRKEGLLNGSKGLLFPVRWHEPFGLAIPESLYYGCPVFGTPYGALSELVTKDVGFLSNNLESLAEALENSANYSAHTCHEYARENFNSGKMADKYLGLYERVLAGESLNDLPPVLKEIETERFLDWVK
jgi:glycosyltransferase involved in cell wall biosynthesis